jgi:hypothetical protein
MWYEIYESSRTFCADEGGMCSNVTCPPGRNMYYGAKVSGSLDRDSGWVKKFVNTSDYTSGEFECKDASFDNFDPIAD